MGLEWALADGNNKLIENEDGELYLWGQGDYNDATIAASKAQAEAMAKIAHQQPGFGDVRVVWVEKVNGRWTGGMPAPGPNAVRFSSGRWTDRATLEAYRLRVQGIIEKHNLQSLKLREAMENRKEGLRSLSDLTDEEMDDLLNFAENIEVIGDVLAVTRNPTDPLNWAGFIPFVSQLRFLKKTGKIESTVEARRAGNRTISAGIQTGDVAADAIKLTARQSGLLTQLPSHGATALFRKGDVSLTDLQALTASTGDEFALFTLGGRRMVVRGKGTTFEGIIGEEWLNARGKEGWRFSGHTHPLGWQATASEGDRWALGVLKEHTGQRVSSVLGANGERSIYSSLPSHLDKGFIDQYQAERRRQRWLEVLGAGE